MTTSLAAVVPAAGLSRRMGREKILLPFGSSTVLETVLEKLKQAGVGEAVVVLRSDLPQAAARARRSGARIVVNERPEEEMLSSIRLGLAALPDTISAFFLWPADHPAVSVATLSLLAAAAAPQRAAIPCHLGRRGHPALVSAALRAGIEAIPPGNGLRYLWQMHPEAVREIEVADPGVLLNVDTPEDYEAALRAVSSIGREEEGGSG